MIHDPDPELDDTQLAESLAMLQADNRQLLRRLHNLGVLERVTTATSLDVQLLRAEIHGLARILLGATETRAHTAWLLETEALAARILEDLTRRATTLHTPGDL